MNTGFNGLNATAEDITKLALLYLNNGQWKGRQILPKDWVREASDIQIRNIHNDKNQKLGYRQGFGRFSEDWKSGYGYLFWHCVPKGAYRGDGIYGQMCVVMPEQDMTVAVAAGCSEPDRILDIVWKYLLPAVDVVCTNDEAQHILERKLRELEIPTVKGEQYHPNQEYLSGRVFKVARNGAGIWQIGFLFPENGMPSVSIVTEKGIFKAWIGYEKWVENETGYDPDGFSCDNVIFFNDAALSGAWQEDEYVIKLVYTRTPFVDTLRVRFLDGRIAGSYTHTVKYGQKSYEIIGIED